MYPLAHAGFAVLAGRAAEWRGRALASRGLGWLALGSLLPDLVDKTVGVALLGIPEGRLLGHSLLFAGAWLAGGKVLQRTWTSPAALVGWGCLTHLLLDLPAAATLAWPLLGPFPIRGRYEIADYFGYLLGQPLLLAGEVGGALVLAGLGWPRLRPALARRGASR